MIGGTVVGGLVGGNVVGGLVGGKVASGISPPTVTFLITTPSIGLSGLTQFTFKINCVCHQEYRFVRSHTLAAATLRLF